MTWFRVDDTLAFHPKVIQARNAAMGLWLRSGSWSSHVLSDGLVPTEVARSLGTKGEAERLVESGLWLPAAGGYQFHQWDQRQPSSADVKRAQDAATDGGKFGNHLRWHKRRGVVDPDCKYCQEDET